jgi:uncharacterized protein (DUF39 family)
MNRQGQTRAPIIGEVVILCGASAVVVGLGAALARHQWLVGTLVLVGMIAIILGQRLRRNSTPY